MIRSGFSFRIRLLKPSIRILVILGFLLFFLAVYFPVSLLTIKNGVFHDVKFPGEESIPFLPWTFFIYISDYLLPAVAFFMVREKKELKGMFLAYGLAIVIHGVFWAVYPVHYLLRPDLGAHPAGLLKVIARFYALDTPAVNCFPSLHVTYAFLSYFVFRRHGSRAAPAVFILVVLISLSTLTFKQHYVADVLGGMVIAYLLNLFFIARREVAI